MAELITTPIRKAIKKMAQISQCARALGLMPTPEAFALRFIGDMKIVARMINNISLRIDEILNKYSSIPTEFLLEGFDEVLNKLKDIDDYAKFTIKETTDVMSNTVKTSKEIVECLGSAVSTTASATLQIGGGLTYGSIAMSANIKLAMTGNGRRSVVNDEVGGIDNLADNIRDWTKSAAESSTNYIDDRSNKVQEKIENANERVEDVKNNGNEMVDETVGVLIQNVEKAKKQVEDQIERVKKIFDNFTKNFDEAFGFINGKNYAEETVRNISNTANEMESESEVFDAIGEVTGEVANFIRNFNIGKVITAAGGIVIGAGTATLAMDLLPSINVDKMLKNVIGGVNTYRIDKITELYYNKYFENAPDLLEIPDVPWRLSKDDLEKYNADGYNKYLEDFAEENDNARSEILKQMQKVKTAADLAAVTKANKEKMKENKSALKAMRKVRRDAIKARMVDRYKGFLRIELDNLKRECNNMQISIKSEWDTMMWQYKNAISEITNFFTTDGCGGNDAIDKCCDRINDDATQIVELCKSITVEITNAVAMVPIPYAVGTCVDMPVHKILAFFKDLKIIITFVANLIRLGIDIISQLTILTKIIFNGIQSLSEIMNTLKKIIGVDFILDMIDFLIALFRPKMADAKLLIENAISPIYYNETEDYEKRVDAIEDLLEDENSGGYVDRFKYTDDPNARKKYRKKVYGGTLKKDDDVEDVLDELEAKGDREIVAYRSPILNTEGDDFAGWIFYHADAYNNMKKSWSSRKKRRRNKVIKKASKKNKMRAGRLIGGVAQLKKNMRFGHYEKGKYIGNSVTGFDAYYWYTKWTNDPTDCDPDFSNGYEYDDEGNLVLKNPVTKDVVSPITTTANGSLVELNDGRRVFVEGKIVKSGDFVNVDGVKYRVK